MLKGLIRLSGGLVARGVVPASIRAMATQADHDLQATVVNPDGQYGTVPLEYVDTKNIAKFLATQRALSALPAGANVQLVRTVRVNVEFAGIPPHSESHGVPPVYRDATEAEQHQEALAIAIREAREISKPVALVTDFKPRLG